MSKLIENITIFDTTLRDGEQAPGATMTIDQKLDIAKLLDKMKVNIIEAGFPASSENEFNAVKKISQILNFSKIAGLLELKNDIYVFKLQKIIKIEDHTFISTSNIHMKYKLKMQPDDVLKAIEESIQYGKIFC